jgi:HEAT repeat protein
MPVTRTQHVLIFVSTASLILLVSFFLVYMFVKGSRGPGAQGAANRADAIPDARLRDLLSDPATRLDAAVQAGDRKLAIVVPLLKRHAAEDDDPRVREACIRSLGKIGDTDAAYVLITAASDRDRGVRLAAIEALSRVPDPACRNELARQTRAEDPGIREAALVALHSFPDEAASTALVAALDDPEERVRLTAVRMLSCRDGLTVRRGLAKGVEDDSVEVRRVAVTALAKKPRPADWPALCRAMLDDDDSVRKPALEAAAKIGRLIVPEVEKTLKTAENRRRKTPTISVAARRDVAELLITIGGDIVVAPLILCLHDADRTSGTDVEELRTVVVEHFQQRGEAVLMPLAEGGIEARVCPFAKEAVARVCRHIGRPAAAPIQQRILCYNLFPNVTELKLWVETLGELGDPGSAAALNRALAQDVPKITDLVAAARNKIEAASGEKLPPAKPDLGEVSTEDAFEIRRGLPPVDNGPPKVRDGELPENCVVFVQLANALVRPENPEQRKPLDLELTRNEGVWETTVVGTGRTYNQGFHVGTVEETGDCRLRIEMQVNDDPWVTGGFGEYEITLECGDSSPLSFSSRAGNGQGLAGAQCPDIQSDDESSHYVEITGSYRGRYNCRPVSGEVTGRLLPLRPPSASDVPPLESGEHPRLVFRRGEVPAMRRRAQTEIGRAIVRAIRDRVSGGGTGDGLDGAIGCGFLYALYGDEPMGRCAVPALITAARRTGFAHAHERAYDLNAASIAYDFVYHCLTDSELEEITTYLAKMQGIVVPSVGITGNFNNGPNSNWTAIGLGGTGLASLATLKEPGPLSVNQPLAVKPAFELVADENADYPNAPVNEFEPNQIIKHWLMAGPVQGVPNVDFVAALGGAKAARPIAGTTVEVEGQNITFAPLPDTAVRKVAGLGRKPHKLVLPAAGKDSKSLLFAVLRVEKESGAKIDVTYPFGFEGATLWIDGREIPSSSSLLLQPGLYRLLIAVDGPIVCPMLYAAKAHQQMGLYQRYLRRQAAYEAAVRRHEETGERQDIPIKLDISKRMMTAWWRLSIGDHGWGTESGYEFAHGQLMPFTVAYETALGERIIPGTGIPWINPLVLAATTDSGRPYFSSLKVVPLGMSLHVVEPEVRPSLLGRFQPDRFAETARRMSCKELVFLFVNYPLNEEPRPAEEVMPKVIADRAKGGYLFRSSYDRGEDDVLAAIFLRSDPRDGPCYFYQESGTFRLVGLGTQWAIGLPGDKRNWQYAQENVVLAPPSNGRGLGKMIYFEAQPDGSGVVGADMSDVYHDGDVPIRATRHFAVDYSGKSGAAVLVAIVDEFEGGGDKTWIMHSGGKSTTVDRDEFNITGDRPDTSLRGRLISSDGIRLATGPVIWNQHNREWDKAQKNPGIRGLKDVKLKREEISERIDYPWGSETTLRAISENERATFYLVMTLQRGDPPAIKVAGKGLDATATVGDRTVKFVDGRLRIE